MAKIVAENTIDIVGDLFRISCDEEGWIYLYTCSSKIKNRFVFMSKLRDNEGEPEKMKRLIKDIKKRAHQGNVMSLILKLLKEYERKEKELEESLKESKDISG